MKKFKVAVCDCKRNGVVISVVAWECEDMKQAFDKAASMSNENMTFIVLGSAY